MRVLVTGASGLIGQALCSHLVANGYSINATVRSPSAMPPLNCMRVIKIGDISSQTDWSEALAGVDFVIHSAARVNHTEVSAGDTLSGYRLVNVLGTRRLADQCVTAGVRRLIFLSSIKVNGECTEPNSPFLASHTPSPQDEYGRSKWEAERVLWEVARRAGLEVVIVRLPLVYGPGVRGNMFRLLCWIAKGIYLPLGAIRNQRSLIGLTNLVDLLSRCLEHPAAAGQTFLASDGRDLSTPDLVRLIADGMSLPARLLPVPVPLLRLFGFVAGKSNEINRLVGSLQADIRNTKIQLGWIPPVSAELGVQEMARWYAGL